ncbi:MAG: exodeoxyribonuclease V subunit alpha [Acidimicrobiia bacterium]
MTLPSRIVAALDEPNAAVGARGLLATFNEARVLAPLDVHAAAAIGRLCGETDDRVLLAAALAVRGARFGHVCIRLAIQRDAVVVDGQAPDVVDDLPWPDPAAWAAAVAKSGIVGDGSGDEPLVLVDDRLYLERYFRYEEQVFDLVDARIGTAPAVLTAETRRSLEQVLPSEPAGSVNHQRVAVERALTGKLTVIAGGPGTGKTHAVGALLATLARGPEGEFPQVALCAPTGKAAARLGEAVAGFAADVDDPAVSEALLGVEASTIHRLLGRAWGRGRFRHHERNRLPHDVVIVDEMSMVSLPLAAKLMAAVRADAAVVLVGDPFQLESIEAGTVLADIVGPAAADAHERPAAVPAVPAVPAVADRVVVLDEVHRFEAQGSIADFADAVRRGEAVAAIDLLRSRAEGLVWVQDRTAPGFDRLLERVLTQRARLVEIAAAPGCEEEALAAFSSLAVLCAHREGPGSVAWWRSEIEAALDQQFTGLRYGGQWYPGRPVMITRNDYRLGLFNGDIGVTVQTAGGLRAVFERGGVRTFPLTYLGEHTTVHAMTIHKSQGSQFDEVVVSLPRETSRLLTRELLYTATTRAAREVTLIGSEAVIRGAIGRSVERASGLGSRLWS